MACLEENLIVAFFSPGRSPEVVAEVEAHTAECEKCRRLLAEFAQLATGLDVSGTVVERTAEGPGLAAAPSLTPSTPRTPRHAGEHAVAGDERDSVRVALVQRLLQAQANKRLGTTLKGKWEIEQLLGAGGMAYVFAARHRNGRRVAIKMMRPELALEPSLVERFLREGYVANKIEHPGAVAILDDDIAEDGTPFLVMELLEGETLRQRLARGALPLDESLRITADVLDVLANAHEKGIIHRDLKPDNLFQTKAGAIKILDFGIARLKEQARPELDTRSGTTMGTIGYMPPEQARGLTAEVDARTDVWAIGATLYSLLTARMLHEAATTNEALLLAMTAPVAPARELLPWLPAPVQAILDQALAFDRQGRFTTARAMKSALDVARGALPTTTLPSAPPPAIGATTELGTAATVPMASSGAAAREQLAPPSTQASRAPSATHSRMPLVAGVGLLLLIVVGGFGVRRALRTDLGATASPAAGIVMTTSTVATPVATPAPSAPATPMVTSSVASSAASATAVPPSRPARPSKSRPVVTAAPAPEPPPVDTRDPLGPRR